VPKANGPHAAGGKGGVSCVRGCWTGAPGVEPWAPCWTEAVGRQLVAYPDSGHEAQLAPLLQVVGSVVSELVA
jgi:hypothetical protein